MFESYDKKIPDYYPTMYMDGYTPGQILHAAKRGLYQKHMERKGQQNARAVVEAALRDVFKGFK